MDPRGVDRLLGALLLGASALWCWGVLATIPAYDDGSGVNARSFPLGAGFLLGVLGAAILLQGFARPAGRLGAISVSTSRGDRRSWLRNDCGCDGVYGHIWCFSARVGGKRGRWRRSFCGLTGKRECCCGGEGPGAGRPRVAFWAASVTVGSLVAYAALLESLGFLIATPAFLLFALGLVLRVRRPAVLVGVALGLPLAIHLVLGKVMGVYLPRGTLVDFTF